MPSIIGLRPIRLPILLPRFFYRVLVFWLLPVIAFAQEPAENLESSVTSSSSISGNKSSEAPLYPSRAMRDKSLIAAEMNDEVQWLETEHGKILALYRQTEARKTLGALILFHAAEHPQYWPPILENLRANLPRYGWETIAISLPQKYPAPVPERSVSSSFSASASSVNAEPGGGTEPATSEEEAANEVRATSSSSLPSSSIAASSSVARELLITTYVDAAFSFLKEKGQLNVVVLADNSSVFQILRHLSPQIRENKRDMTTLDGPLQALIIVNLQEQEPLTKAELETVFSTEQLPLLDLFFAPANFEQTESRELHRAIAMRKKIMDYYSLLIDNQPKRVEQDHQSYLLGRVRGFMKQKASGTELKGRDEATTNNPSQ